MAAWSQSEVPYSPPKFHVLSLKKILWVYSLRKKIMFYAWISKKIPSKKIYACSLCPRNKNLTCSLYQNFFYVFSLPKESLPVFMFSFFLFMWQPTHMEYFISFLLARRYGKSIYVWLTWRFPKDAARVTFGKWLDP